MNSLQDISVEFWPSGQYPFAKLNARIKGFLAPEDRPNQLQSYHGLDARMETKIQGTNGSRSVYIQGWRLDREAPRLLNPEGKLLDLDFFIELNPQQLDFIEEIRASRDLQVEANIRIRFLSSASTTRGANEVKNFHGNSRSSISQSDWAKRFLPALGLGSFDLWEVATSTTPNVPNLQRARELIQKAQQQFQFGHYEESFIHCRKATESMEQICETGDYGHEITKRAIRKEKHALSVPVHEGITARQTDRHDAEFAISLTLSYYRRIAHYVQEKR